VSASTLRRAGVIAAAVIVTLGGLYALQAVLSARDDATFDTAAGPGQSFPDLGARHLRPGEAPGGDYNSDPPTSGPHVPLAVRRQSGPLVDDQILHALESGNVVIVTAGGPQAEVRALAREVAGPFTPELAAAGQTVLLTARPGTEGVTALAWRHMQQVDQPGDPRLREFVEFWLGRGVG